MRLGILSIDETAKNILAAILSPGALALSGINLPAAGNNTFSVPGMLEVASNTAQLVGTNQQTVQTGQEQVRIAMQSLDYQRQIVENTGLTADHTRQIVTNTTAIVKMATALEGIERNQRAAANAARSNGVGGF